ncbi:CX domain-containing protein [Caenorhabditis elegans]|uniref:CX domain-containing protein n=1 Tax=Caenorhabditis elegans TaxID=6239 RepID=H2KY71_CAEEL|nr:CX domain-containing protein [Caenorhabditis elegans]CCD61434.1 CX domain-containing protein [Caenorhabditis elegans]|eukprot:NP_741584.1 Hexosyltransferase [Caenorhabditis elegans]
MRISPSYILIFLLVFFQFDDTLARGGRGGGGRGGGGRGGRGRSGARSGVGGSRSRPQMRSGIRGSSSFSGGIRSGAHGYKVQTKTSTFSNYGSSSFRSAHLYHSPHLQKRPGHPFVIIAATTPLFYDNRNYYWSYGLAKSTQNSSYPGVICEYVFGEDDGELQNITFANATQVKSIFFSCSGRVDCCGMYCCHDFNQWFELAFVFGFIAVMCFIAYYAKKNESERPEVPKDLEPLRPKTKTKTKVSGKPS